MPIATTALRLRIYLDAEGVSVRMVAQIRDKGVE
jgi:hypothetical protein